MSPFLYALLIWGVWLIIPVIIDGIGALLRVSSVLVSRRRWTDPYKYADIDLPTVSIIVPAYNEEKIIERCINSIKLQEYPHEKMEILVIDDGSVDATRQVVLRNIEGTGVKKVKINGTFLSVDEFNGTINLFTSGMNKGKSNALNLGIENAHGDIIFTIDSDAVLDKFAIRNMIVYLLDHPNIGAACGVIEINEHLIDKRDEDGRIVTDAEGHPVEEKLSLFESLLAKSQFLEYLNAFRLGRHYQSLINSEYMLSGAFSAFKRAVIKNLHYSELTVAEDFDISLDLHQQGVDVGFAPDAKVWVEPVIDTGSLYAQRLRWRRGQLEVMGVHKNMVGSNKFGTLGRIGLPSMLMLDHTLAFPRIVWTFIILMFPLFGYSSRIVALYFVMLFVFHVVFDIIQTLAAYTISDKETKKGIENAFQYVLILPFFRLLVFYFRMSGYLVVFKEPQKWKVSTPFSGLREQMATVQHRIDGGASNIMGFLYSVFYLFRV